MPRYICKNEECSKYNIEQFEVKSTIKYTSEGVIDTAAPCPECGSIRESVTVGGMTTNMQGGPNVCKR